MESPLAGRPYLSTKGSKSWATEISAVERRKNRRKRKSNNRADQRDQRQCTNQRRRRRNSQPTQAPGRVRSSVRTAERVRPAMRRIVANGIISPLMLNFEIWKSFFAFLMM